MKRGLRVTRIVSREHFERYAPSLRGLLRASRAALLDDDDFQAGVTSEEQLDALMDNLADSAPHVWLAVDANGLVYAGASLTDMEPGVRAALHGVSRAAIRRHPVIAWTARAALDVAFNELGAQAVYAECRADNAGAKGFCWRCGFHGEGRVKNAVTVDGRPVDLLLYALTRADYFARTRRILSHGIRQEKD